VYKYGSSSGLVGIITIGGVVIGGVVTGGVVTGGMTGLGGIIVIGGIVIGGLIVIGGIEMGGGLLIHMPRKQPAIAYCGSAVISARLAPMNILFNRN